MKALPSQAELQAALAYDPGTGELRWKRRDFSWFSADRRGKAFNTRCAGKLAFATAGARGYLKGRINGCDFYAHRVIWKLVHGEDPEEVDHINGVRGDNRLCNLRNVSREVNGRNLKLKSTNTSGHAGVYLHACGKWAARIRVSRRMLHIGLFFTFEEAVSARLAAERLHGFHPNHGRRVA